MAHRLTLKPHTTKVSKSGTAVVTDVTPYIRIVGEGDPPLYIQRGHFYTETGKVVEDIPEWAQEAVDKLSDAAKIEVGLMEPDDSRIARNSDNPPGPRPRSARAAKAAAKAKADAEE